jgi:hypothetical protein
VDTADETPGGQGDDTPRRSDLTLVRQAVRQDWPIPAPVQRQILQRLVDYLDRDSADGEKAKPRTVIAAARTLAAFGGLALKQQALDLRKQQVEGKPETVSLSDLVQEAETRAEKRISERECEDREAEAGHRQKPAGPA